MVIDFTSILEFETMANTAMPSLKSYLHDGWLLRFSEGYTKRANSVHPLFTSTHDLATKIHFCEEQYASRGLPTIFKMTPASQPGDLDDYLAAQGYTLASPTLLQTTSLMSLQSDSVITGEPLLSKAWLQAYQTIDPVPQIHHQTLHKTLLQIPFPTWYASLTDEHGNIRAVGLAVLQLPRVGIFNIVVEGSQRGRGLGRQIMNMLLTWGQREGAEQAYLQVSADNTPAVNLYASLGFNTEYQYWYRLR